MRISGGFVRRRAKNERQCGCTNERKRAGRRKATPTFDDRRSHYPSESNNRRVQLRRTKRCHNGASFKENTGQFARMKNWSLLYYNRWLARHRGRKVNDSFAQRNKKKKTLKKTTGGYEGTLLNFVALWYFVLLLSSYFICLGRRIGTISVIMKRHN